MAEQPGDKNQKSSKDGTTVTLTGSGVTAAAAVTFGAVPAACFVVADEAPPPEPPEPFIVDG